MTSEIEKSYVPLLETIKDEEFRESMKGVLDALPFDPDALEEKPPEIGAGTITWKINETVLTFLFEENKLDITAEHNDTHLNLSYKLEEDGLISVQRDSRVIFSNAVDNTRKKLGRFIHFMNDMAGESFFRSGEEELIGAQKFKTVLDKLGINKGKVVPFLDLLYDSRTYDLSVGEYNIRIYIYVSEESAIFSLTIGKPISPFDSLGGAIQFDRSGEILCLDMVSKEGGEGVLTEENSDVLLDKIKTIIDENRNK